jgi:hypothetical protein
MSRQMSKPYTTAIFEVGDRIYHGCASFDHTQEKPWFAGLVHENEWYTGLGYFTHVKDAWDFARRHLGLSVEPALLRREGEGTDGGPIQPNKTYIV